MTDDLSLDPTIHLNAATDPITAALQTQMQNMQSGMQAMLGQIQQFVQGCGNNQGGRHGGCAQGGCGRGRGRGWGQQQQNSLIQNFAENPFLQQYQNLFQQ